jgi:hypothetical protein
MGGGLMQLVAYGAQDIYLTGNPQITFFKVVYRRHTNFSMEAIRQTFNGSVGATASSVTATISRNGDLVHKMWLDVKMGACTVPDEMEADASSFQKWINNTGHAVVSDCELEIGGQRIDRQYSRWLDVWNELTDPLHKDWVGLNKSETIDVGADATAAAGAIQLYIPLQFWFCRNPGLALPLIALQYHEVKVKINTRAVTGLICGNASGGSNAAVAGPTSFDLYCDYIYLDTDERRRFAQVSHEYLIEQVQQQVSTTSNNVKLNFNHPVKELVWVMQNSTVGTAAATATLATQANVALNYGIPTAQDGSVGDSLAGPTFENNDYFNYSIGSQVVTDGLSSRRERIKDDASIAESFQTMKLQLNGHDRFVKRNASYFRLVQPSQHHSGPHDKHIYSYSFALKPEEHQPSGTCNFSRIDNAQMVFENAAATNMQNIHIWAVNYNVLRIMSGMGGLAYSN